MTTTITVGIWEYTFDHAALTREVRYTGEPRVLQLDELATDPALFRFMLEQARNAMTATGQ